MAVGTREGRKAIRHQIYRDVAHWGGELGVALAAGKLAGKLGRMPSVNAAIARGASHISSAVGRAGGALGRGVAHVADRFNPDVANLGERVGHSIASHSQRGGESLGRTIVKWGPAGIGYKAAGLAMGGPAIRRTYKENKDLAKKLGLPRNTVTPWRATTSAFIPTTSLAVRSAYRKKYATGQ